VPFTGSHPAAILPLLGTPLPASALVLGSMSPDFLYYLPNPGLPTHTLPALALVDVPLALVVWAVWHALVAAPVLAAAPDGFRARLTDIPVGLVRRLPRLPWVALALITGALTHLLWDEFTHANRYAVRHLGWLHDPVAGQPGYQWAQYASGVFGAVVMLHWLRGWWRRTPALPVSHRESHPLVLLALLVVGVAAGVVAARGSSSFNGAAFLGATRGGGAAALVALVYAAGWHAARSRRRAS
jgi:hypothetical protein